MLHHLSMDPGFRGTVVCDVHPTFFFTGISVHGGPQAACVQEYDRRTACSPIEWRLRLATQRLFVFRHPQLIPSMNCLRDWSKRIGGPAPTVEYVEMLPDRSKRADYSKVNAIALGSGISFLGGHTRPAPRRFA